MKEHARHLARQRAQDDGVGLQRIQRLTQIARNAPHLLAGFERLVDVALLGLARVAGADPDAVAACAEGELCSAGQCGVECLGGSSKCGDLCVDINGCPLCPVTRTADITKGPVAGLANDSAVVFVSCVLEYVSDPESALGELRRMAGSPENLFIVFVDPWSVTAALYPGANWAGGKGGDHVAMKQVTVTRKLATAGGLAGLLVLAIRGGRR